MAAPPLRIYREPVTFGWPALAVLLPEHAVPECVGDRFGTGGDADLGEDVPDVVLHGPLAEEQLVGDLLVRQPLGEEPQDLTFSLREPAGRPGSRNGSGADPQPAQHGGGL